MRRLGLIAPAICALALSACGSGSKAASSASVPATSSASVPTASPTTSSTTTTTRPSGGTRASTTRTATEPAFTQQPSSVEGLAAASSTVRAHGFTPVNTSDYRASQTLRVLIGRRAGAPNSQNAFFFVDGRYIGTDALEPSGMLAVLAQGDTEVTLAYSLYSPSDSLCCPGAGQARVRFQLNNGKLVALDPIPPAHSSSGSSRR